jgi:hypothetical protein
MNWEATTRKQPFVNLQTTTREPGGFFVNRFGSRTIACILSLLLIGTSALRVSAQPSSDARPAVVVSVSSVDRLLGDIGALTRTAGWPQIGGLVTLLTSPYTQDLDAKSPGGMFVSLNGGEPSGAAFIGVKNFENVMKKLEEQFGKAEELGDGVLKLSLQRDFFIKHQGNWLYVSDKAANLGNVPADPTRYLASLNGPYTVAVQVNADAIPEELKAAALEGLKKDAQKRLERELEGKSDDDRRQAELSAQQGLEVLGSLIQDTEQVTLGWGTDRTANKTALEFTLTAKAATKLAEHLNRNSKQTSRIAPFPLPESAVNLLYNISVPPAIAAMLVKSTDNLRAKAVKAIDDNPSIPDSSTRTAIKEAANLLIDVLAATCQQGQFQGAVAVKLVPGALQVAVGGTVADGAKVEKALRGVAGAMKDVPEFPAIKFAAQNHRNVALHTLTVPVPSSDANATKIFGSQVDVALGTSPDRAYIAMGGNAVELLKKALDAQPSASGASPFALKVALTPILSFAGAMNTDPNLEKLAKASGKTSGKDHILIVAKAAERSVTYRLEIEEGVLSLIGEAAKIQGANGGEN